MNIKRKVIPMEIEGKEYEMILDFGSAMEFQDLYGKAIFVGLDKIGKEQDLKALACLIASCLKYKGKAVGLDFVAGMDLMSGLSVFMEKIAELMDNSLPAETDSKKK